MEIIHSPSVILRIENFLELSIREKISDELQYHLTEFGSREDARVTKLFFRIILFGLILFNVLVNFNIRLYYLTIVKDRFSDWDWICDRLGNWDLLCDKLSNWDCLCESDRFWHRLKDSFRDSLSNGLLNRLWDNGSLRVSNSL
jgi:hypothetical protein